MNSLPSCHRVDTVVIDGHIAVATQERRKKLSEPRSCRLTNPREE
jgi:hypothetical protein